MRSKVLLVLLTTLCSALSWCPAFVEPNIGVPFWIPLVCVVLCTCLSTALTPTTWPWLLPASTLGTFGGLCLTLMIWPPSDPIAAAYTPFFVVAISLVVTFVAVCAAVIMHRRYISKTSRRVIWAALFTCVAFGPVALGLTAAVTGHDQMLPRGSRH